MAGGEIRRYIFTKRLKIVFIIFLILAISFIAFSFFDIKYKRIFGVIGYGSLIIGQILNLIYLVNKQRKNLKK